MSLQEKARQHAAQSFGDLITDTAAVLKSTLVEPEELGQQGEQLPDIEYTGKITDPEQVPVHVAFARVMADVQAISKDDRRNDVGGKYNFRGVDRVVNAVGPALRRHGVLCLPVQVYDVEYKEARTSKGTVMQDVTLKVKWRVTGPMGDQLPDLLESAGQAVDTADKGTAKAESVAQRVLFLTGLHIPTNQPDIDQGHERGERPVPRAGDYVEEICNPKTSLSRLLTIKSEVERFELGEYEITNNVGDREPLGKLLYRIGRERELAQQKGGE